MELSDSLILGNLITTFIIFIMVLYCLGKIKMMELVMQRLKDPEKVFNEIMKTKIPIIMGPQGPVMPMDMGVQPQIHNPLTG